MVRIDFQPYPTIAAAKAALWRTPEPAEGELMIWDYDTGHDFEGVADAVRALQDGMHIRTGWYLF